MVAGKKVRRTMAGKQQNVLTDRTRASHAEVLQKEFMHHIASNPWNPQLCNPFQRFSDFMHPEPKQK
jgi:hypothetical protein